MLLPAAFLEQMMKTLVIAAFTALVTSASVATPRDQLRELGQLMDDFQNDRQEQPDASYDRRSEPREYDRRGPRDYRRSDPRDYDDRGSREYERRSRSRE